MHRLAYNDDVWVVLLFGGEPFINPDLLRILEATLQVGPATVLTNATLLSPQAVTELCFDARRLDLLA